MPSAFGECFCHGTIGAAETGEAEVALLPVPDRIYLCNKMRRSKGDLFNKIELV